MEAIFRIGERYLNLQTPIQNGGAFSVVINNIEFNATQLDTGKIQNLSLWTSYIKEFLFNTSRLKATFLNESHQINDWTSVSNPNYGSSIMMIGWLVTFLLLTCVTVAVMIRQCLADRKSMTKTGTCKRTRTIRSFRNRDKRNRIIIIFSMTLMIIIWTIFMILLCIGQYLVSTKFANNTGSNTTSKYASVKDAASMSFGYLDNFFNIITNQTSVFLVASIAKISQNSRNQLRVSIVEFGNQVLVTFNVTTLLNTAQMLIDNINQVVTAMTFIKEHCQKILVEVDNIKGSIGVYQNNLNSYLANICPTLKDNVLQDTCRSLQTQINIFAVNIETNLVSSSSSVIMLFVLQQYNINITTITTSVVQVNSDFQHKLNSLYNSTANQFDVSSYLDFVPTVWSNLVRPLIPSLSNTSTYATTTNSYVDTVSKYENLVIIIILLIILMTFTILLSSFRDSIQRKFLNRCLSTFVQLCYIVSLTISALVCLSVLILVNFSQSEICNQVNTTKGVALLDKILNVKFATPWNRITKSISSSIQNVDLTLVPPTNILSGIKDRCGNSSVGLLSVVGIRNIVNVSNLINSRDVMTAVAKAKVDSLKAFLDVNPQQIIPQDIMSFVGQTSKLISYFDGVNYEVGINELRKPLVGLQDHIGLFSNLNIFSMNASTSIGWTSDLKYFHDTVNQLQMMSSNLTNLQQMVQNLSLQFQTLEMYRNNTFLLNQLVKTITDVLTLFKNPSQLTTTFSAIYDDFIGGKLVNEVVKVISDGIDDVLGRILPCGDLARIYEAISTSVCSPSNLNDALATLGVILLVEVIFCQIMAVIIIVSISMRFNCKDISS